MEKHNDQNPKDSEAPNSGEAPVSGGNVTREPPKPQPDPDPGPDGIIISPGVKEPPTPSGHP